MNIDASFYKKFMLTKTILVFIVISLLNHAQSQAICDYNICQCQNSTCMSCLDSSFYYNSTVKICYLCPPQCLTCSTDQQCLTCRQMFYYSNIDQQCYKCPKYCRTCAIVSNSTLLTCSQCITGYVLIGSSCQKCQVQNVQSCQSLMTVKTCLSKFWKNGDSCSPCRQFCVFCTSSNNCLKCQDGYRTRVSAGTFCVACDIGCKTCTDTSCSECFFNYRLISGKCQSIDANCSLIANCQKCQYSATNTPLMVKCLLCDYPYYINSNSTCTKGSSILCNYANAQNSYQCLNECSDYGYKIKTVSTTSNKNVDQIMCLPRLWIQNTAIQQIYFNSLFARRYSNIFTPITNWTILCSSQYMATAVYSDLSNNLKFSYVFQPYYKLVFHLKYLPAFRSATNVSDLVLNSSIFSIAFQVSMADNSSNSYSYQQILSKDNFRSCQQEYISISSRNIKDQNVSIQFKAQFINSTSPLSNLISTDQLLLSNFPSGILSYKQILIQIYRCDSKCRICSNTKYCLECYPPLFLSTYVCVESCQGLFQFYLPNGNYINYTSRYCVQDCQKGYYSTNHPLKNGTFICLKCPQKCKTCRSATQCLSCNQPWLFYSTNFSCVASCPDTNYPNNISLECTPCNAPCKTCKSQTQCLTCSIGYFDGKNCVGMCPQSTYSTSTSHQCLPCDSKCFICQNTPTYCSACQTNYKLLGSTCLSSCPLNTHYQYNGVCLTCKSPCTLCSSQTVCITCSRGYLFNSSCLSECPSGYYKDIGNNRCNVCQNNCKTCISQSICKTCVNGTYLYNSMCLVQCPIKTYINSNGVCIPCIPPCLTCFDQLRCLNCSIGYLSLVQNFTCLTDCQPGYFGYSSNQTCIKCSSQCLTCKQQADFCLSCPLNKLLEKYKCVSNCSLGYFSFNNQKCRRCSYPCLTCIDISSKCLTCQSPFILLGDYKCSLRCLSTQYKKNGTCLNCASPCSSCTQINSCTSCVRANSTTNQKYLYFNNCLQYCPEGMYKDPISLRCKDCIFPCLNCLSSRQCLSCISGYLNTQKKSCQICSSYYYPDDSTKTCKLCSSVLQKCQQCLSSTVCKVCYSGYFLFNNTCVSSNDCSLKSGYYINYQTKRCAQCVPPCKDCVSATYCKTCINGFYFEGKCRFTCLQGYFANLTSNICQQCNYSVCLSCQNSANHCLSCNQTSLLNVLFPQNQTCINQSDCGMMYYLDSSYGYKRCLKCISPCKTCNNSSFCTSCVAGVLYKGSCSFSCPNKFFAQDQNSTLGITGNILTVTLCQQCSSICLQCSFNDTNCISCPTSKFLQNGSCVDKCSPTFYLNQYIFQCIKCQSPCVLCDSATYCLSCQNSSKILYYGQCIDQCPEGTYINKAQCITCPQQCQICQYSATKATVICKKCSSGLYMNSTNEGVCQSTCKTNEYPDSQTRKCYPCQIPCLQCLTATKCKSCISEYLLYSNNQCLKGTQCRKGTFLDPQIEGKCLQLCYQPYYGDYLTLKCNETCSNKNLKIVFGPQRVCDQKCPDNYYVDNGFVCNQCQNNICDDILRYQIYPKSIFNKLYLKIKFSKNILTALIDQKDITIIITQLQQFTNNQNNRRLQSTLSNSSLPSTYSFTITQRSPRALWLQIHTFQTLKKISIKVHFSSYYLFSPTSNPSPSTNLQNLNTSVLVQRFDQYTSEQQQQGKSFQKFSIFLSFLTLLIIIVSMILNSLSLFYKLIDYFQLLFLLIFLQIDYPPILNYFLYGFRYAHYLFLPQIFRPTDTSQKQQYSQTPGKFGIIVPDADFLTNTGHDFLIIFIAIGVVIIVKIIDFLLSGRIKNNKVSNDPNEEKQHKESSLKDNNQIQSGVGIVVHNRKQKSEDYNVQNTPGDHNDQNHLHNKLKTHNIIQLQILQGKHGKLAKYSKIFISRLKWNYFNDISYCLYFYIALFSYSQTYIISQTKFISNMFAFIGFTFTLGLPIFFIYLLNNNKQQIFQSTLQSQNKNSVHLPFKTFYYFLIPDSSYTLYTIPIRYIQKLIFAILLVFCSEFPQFVLGIILMTTILTMILNYLYKPFLLTIQLYVQLVIDLLFVIIIFLLCVVELDYLMLQTASKLAIAKLIVAITVIMTLGLVFWNIVRLIVEFIKACGGKDYFENYYRETEEFEGLRSQVAQLTEKRKSSKSRISIAAGLAEQFHTNSNGLDEQSNVRLHPGFMSPKQVTSSVNFNSRLSQDQYSGLDIYLKKQSNAPPMLIKCIKDFQGQEEQQSQHDDDDDDVQKQSQKSGIKDNDYKQSQPKQSSQSHSQQYSQASPNKNTIYNNNQPKQQQNPSKIHYQSQQNYKKASIYKNRNQFQPNKPTEHKTKPIFPHQNAKNVVLNFQQEQEDQQSQQASQKQQPQKQQYKQKQSQQSQDYYKNKKQPNPNLNKPSNNNNNNQNLSNINIQNDPFIQFQQFNNKNIFINSQAQEQPQQQSYKKTITLCQYQKEQNQQYQDNNDNQYQQQQQQDQAYENRMIHNRNKKMKTIIEVQDFDRDQEEEQQYEQQYERYKKRQQKRPQQKVKEQNKLQQQKNILKKHQNPVITTNNVPQNKINTKQIHVSQISQQQQQQQQKQPNNSTLDVGKNKNKNKLNNNFVITAKVLSQHKQESQQK